LPALSKELKLSHRRGDELGSYHGKWNGYKIRIEPNNYYTSIGIRVSGDPQFSAIHTGIAEKKLEMAYLFQFLTKIIIKFIPDYPVVENNNPKFSFEDPALDKYFKDRRILGERGKDNTRDAGLQNAIKDFLKKNRKAVRNLVIGSEVSCSLWVGSSSGRRRDYSVTARQARHMLSEMLPVAEAMERAMRF